MYLRKRHGITVSHLLAAAVACLACTVCFLKDDLYRMGTVTILNQLFWHHEVVAAASYVRATWDPDSALSKALADQPDVKRKGAAEASQMWNTLRGRERRWKPTFSDDTPPWIACEVGLAMAA